MLKPMQFVSQRLKLHPLSRSAAKWALWCAIAFGAAVMSTAEANPSLRCGGYLVSKGDPPVSLLQKCGEPAYRQAVCVSMQQLGWIVTPFRSDVSSALLAAQCVPMEEWTYDRGYGTFFGIVRIYNGVIESVRDGDRRP